MLLARVTTRLFYQIKWFVKFYNTTKHERKHTFNKIKQNLSIPCVLLENSLTYGIGICNKPAVKIELMKMFFRLFCIKFYIHL